jgi:hypothetical protein
VVGQRLVFLIHLGYCLSCISTQCFNLDCCHVPIITPELPRGAFETQSAAHFILHDGRCFAAIATGAQACARARCVYCPSGRTCSLAGLLSTHYPGLVFSLRPSLGAMVLLE